MIDTKENISTKYFYLVALGIYNTEGIAVLPGASKKTQTHT